MSAICIDPRKGPEILCVALLLTALAWPAGASDSGAERIRIKLGDYHFEPSQLTLIAGRTAVLELVNTDGITPHNFTLQDVAGALDIDVDVPAGESREVSLTPSVSGTYTFYCNKKLLFLKSHRARGMEGSLNVVPR
jgi:plastocyanin